ncbi:hypothetical protein LJC27_04010 [Christensenellaceae bacterium OttesenSCG-928-M15]|nr:hypothetical protein [Christensenellaceae bacterium OttesenSCG-928-M15]
MKVIGFAGSPRKAGNTAWAVNAFLMMIWTSNKPKKGFPLFLWIFHSREKPFLSFGEKTGIV